MEQPYQQQRGSHAVGGASRVHPSPQANNLPAAHPASYYYHYRRSCNHVSVRLWWQLSVDSCEPLPCLRNASCVCVLLWRRRPCRTACDRGRNLVKQPRTGAAPCDDVAATACTQSKSACCVNCVDHSDVPVTLIQDLLAHVVPVLAMALGLSASTPSVRTLLYVLHVRLIPERLQKKKALLYCSRADLGIH